MIQRIQSVYLLIGAICGLSSAAFPFIVSESASNLHSILPFIGAALGALSLISIFLFKNRSLQALLTTIGTVLSVVLMGIGFWQVNSFEFSAGDDMGLAYYLWSGLPMGFWLATKAIRKDIKLVKSMDSFR